MYREPLTHASENIGDNLTHLILVELKDAAGAGAAPPHRKLSFCVRGGAAVPHEKEASELSSPGRAARPLRKRRGATSTPVRSDVSLHCSDRGESAPRSYRGG